MHQLLKTLRALGGYYQCPKDTKGRRLGPLVGYAGKYEDQKSQTQKQLVGEVYFNFAQLERQPTLLINYVARLTVEIQRMNPGVRLIFCGMPEGGKAIAFGLAELMNGFYIYPEKRVLKAATVSSREESELFFSRHEVGPGDQILLVEDVANNFSTTRKAVELITRAGGTVRGIICLINRSPKLEHDSFFSCDGREFPLISVLRISIPEYKQEDQAVAADVERGNICFDPKKEWSRLQQAMQDAEL